MIFLDNDTDIEFDFKFEEIANDVISKALRIEKCPFETEVNILLTDNEGIREYNNNFRGIDNATDVLSFPNIEYEKESDFNLSEDELPDYVDPETGLVVLGDIIISLDRVISQASEYGHSNKREFAFLIAHSILHLCGYDHITDDEAARMEEKQNIILNELNITRDN